MGFGVIFAPFNAAPYPLPLCSLLLHARQGRIQRMKRQVRLTLLFDATGLVDPHVLDPLFRAVRPDDFQCFDPV